MVHHPPAPLFPPPQPAWMRANGDDPTRASLRGPVTGSPMTAGAQKRISAPFTECRHLRERPEHPAMPTTAARR